MPLRTVKLRTRRFKPRRDVCPICGYQHDGDCDPVVLRAIDAADRRADCLECIKISDASKDLTLGESLQWLDEMAERYPEEFAEIW